MFYHLYKIEQDSHDLEHEHMFMTSSWFNRVNSDRERKTCYKNAVLASNKLQTTESSLKSVLHVESDELWRISLYLDIDW